MTYAEARALKEAGIKVRELEARMDAMLEYVAILEQRKRGRPSEDEQAHLADLKERMNGQATH